MSNSKKKTTYKVGDVVMLNESYHYAIVSHFWKRIHLDKSYAKASDEVSKLFGETFIISEIELFRPKFSRNQPPDDEYTIVKADDPTFVVDGILYYYLIEIK